MMAKKMGGLGRGLDALLGDYEISTQSAGMVEVDIDLLQPNPEQPRKQFDKARLEELSGSIRQHGMVQPIVVRKQNDRYMIITGERRYRAAKLAGLQQVPIVERQYEDEEIHEIALIENIQREDLNPIEEATAIAFLMHQHDLTQEEVSARLSKSRPAVANTLRLLQLSDEVKNLLKTGALSAGHGRALSSIADHALQEKLAKQAVENAYSVRAIEQIVKAQLAYDTPEEELQAPKKTLRPKKVDVDLQDVEARLREKLHTKVKITGSKKRGKITIEYYSMDALQELFDMIVQE